MAVPLLIAESRWACPNCDQTDVTSQPEPHTRMHACPGARGMTVPFVPAGIKAKVVLHERQDYIGREIVQTDGDGRPVMNVTVTREDGEDVAVYAPCATGGAEQ